MPLTHVITIKGQLVFVGKWRLTQSVGEKTWKKEKKNNNKEINKSAISPRWSHNGNYFSLFQPAFKVENKRQWIQKQTQQQQQKKKPT